MLDRFENDTLIICPNSYKKKLLASFYNEKKIINVSFMTIEEYKKNYYFDYDYKAIKYLMDKYKYSVNNAKEIIENIYYVEDKEYDIQKLDDLVKYRKELIQNNLLIFNKLFNKYLNNKKVIVVGYGQLDEFNSKLFSNVVEYDYIDKQYDIYEFSDIEKEVEYVYNAIFDLLNEGIDINKIYLLNVADEYQNYLKRFNTYYDFKIENKKTNSLYATIFGQEFLNKIKDNISRTDLYNGLLESKNEYSNKLINIINKYIDTNLIDVYDFIVEDLKNISIDDKLSNVVKCVDLYQEFNDDEYVFMLGFNDSIPVVKKDNEYLTDNIRKIVGMSTIEEENKLIKINTVSYLSNIKNLYLSYCLSTPFNEHNKQIILANVNYLNVVNDNKHSNSLNKNKYNEKLDNLNKYGIKDNDLNMLYASYDTNEFNSYDNSYKQFDIDLKNVSLSYSSMNSYYQCSFSYYLNSILKIDPFDSNFNNEIGTIAHDTLQLLLSKQESDFDCAWDRAIKKNEIIFDDEKDIFFTNKIKEEIREDYQIILEQNSHNNFKASYEKNINIKVNKNISFNGKIDKLLEHNNNLVIVDYKTGNTKISTELFEYGLSLQLPSYVYLVKRSDEYKNSRIIGYYLQHLINDDNKYNDKKDKDEIKVESMKLDGFTNSDENLMELLDGGLKENKSSYLVKSLTTKKDGQLSAAALNTLKSDEEIDELVNLVEDKILNAGNNILDNQFSINPKLYDGKNLSCTYCNFKDVCYRRNKDYAVYVKEEKEEEWN